MEYNGSITLLPEGILSHSSCNRCRNSHIWADRDSNMCQTRHNRQLSSFSDSWPEYNVTKEAVCIVYRLSATHLQPHAARMPTECVSGSRLLLFAPEGSFLCEHPTGSRARLEWAPLRSAAPRQLAVWMWTWSLGPGVGGGGGGGGGGVRGSNITARTVRMCWVEWTLWSMPPGVFIADDHSPSTRIIAHIILPDCLAGTKSSVFPLSCKSTSD